MINEAIEAFKSPSWWILTVIVGLTLNVGAPFINRIVDGWWTKRSKRRAAFRGALEKHLKEHVEALANRPTGLVEQRTLCIYWTVRIILLLCVYTLLTQLAFFSGIPYGDYLTIPIALAAFFHISKYWSRRAIVIKVHNSLYSKLFLEPPSGELGE